MKLSFKTWRTWLTAVLCLAVALCSFVAALVFNPITASAAVVDDYYQSQLGPEAKRFYNAIKAMDESGALKTGNGEYDLIANNVVTATQLADISENSDVMVAFGAARDAYSMDHPELFYIDLSYLLINVGTKGSGYVATLGTGRAASYYIEDGFSSVEEVNAAITKFNNAVNAIVTEANKLSTDAEKITYVNKTLAEGVTYTYVPEEESAGSYIHNPYGALVNKAAVCEGYSRAFKVVMDKLDIACVLVPGYGRTSNDDDEEETWQAHMWNNVRLDNLWYGIDSTWNSNFVHDGLDVTQYLLKGSIDFNHEHIADTVVSAVGFEFSYPLLNAYNYNATAEDMGGFEFTFTQSGVNQVVRVSYEGKGAKALATEGKYLAVKFTYADSTLIPQWYCPTSSQFMYDEDTETYTEFTNYASTYKTVQFAVFTVAPDLYNENFDETYQYSAEPAAANIVAMTAEIGNGASAKKVATPYATKLTPSNSSALNPETETYDVEIQYSEKLKRDNGVENVGVKVTNKNGDSLVAKGRVEIENFTWDGDTVKFTLKPSKQYSDTDYLIELEGLIGSDSNLAPDQVSYRFWRKSTVCSKVFNDGRLWMNVYGTPNLVADSDLSEVAFKDENGELYSKNQRSQLMLVASKPSDEKSADMIDKATTEMGVNSSDVLQSSTYEIDLLLCGCVQTVPDGSYMQVGFGFPEGYGPEDAGATFKVFHYKSDGSVEEIPCVVTEYGIIATVSSFSPYAIVAVKSDAVTNSLKSAYARTVGLGGEVTVTKGSEKSHGVVGVASGESITYTFTPNAGYTAERIVLNGKETLLNGATSVTYTYEELADNNMLEVYFVANTVAEREKTEGITPVYTSVKTVLPVAGSSNKDTADSNTPSTTNGTPSWLVPVVVVAAVLVVVAVATVVVIKIRKRKNNN